MTGAFSFYLVFLCAIYLRAGVPMIHMYPVTAPGSCRMMSNIESPKDRSVEIKPEGRTPYTSKVPEGTPSMQHDPPALEVCARRVSLSGCHSWSDAVVDQGNHLVGIHQVFSDL
jgi:hypothetical protein